MTMRVLTYTTSTTEIVMMTMTGDTGMITTEIVETIRMIMPTIRRVHALILDT